jgi:predicted membrane channel-forming protein YqfA (hemolysin III family)
VLQVHKQLTDRLLTSRALAFFFRLEQDKLVYCLLGYSPVFVLQILHQKLDNKLVAYVIYACIAYTVCSWFFLFFFGFSSLASGVLNLSSPNLSKSSQKNPSQKYFSKAVQNSRIFFPFVLSLC